MTVPKLMFASATNPTAKIVSSPIGLMNGQFGAQALDTSWTVLSGEFVEPPFLASAPRTFLVGVISKAIDGIAVRHDADVVIETNASDRFPQYFNHLGPSVSAGQKGLGLRSIGADHKVTTLVSRAGKWHGFIDAPITIDARALITANRAAFLATIDDDKVRARYADAFDAELALGKSMATLQQARLWFGPLGGLTGRSPTVSATKSGDYGAFVEDSSVLMVLKPFDQDDRKLYDAQMSGTPRPDVTVTLPYPGDRPSAGVKLPCLFTRVSAARGWPVVDHVGHDGLSADELRVPYKVNLNGDLVEAGNVFGMVSPALRKIESTETLDFLDQVKKDLARVREVEVGYSTGLSIDEGTPDDRKAAAVDAGFEAERLRRSAVDKIKPSLRPAVAAIVEFTNRVDERVAEGAKS